MSDIPRRAPNGGPVADDGLTAALPPGTEILTLAGALPVEALYPGDRIITRDAGAQSVRSRKTERLRSILGRAFLACHVFVLDFLKQWLSVSPVPCNQLFLTRP
ncbi:Hint domain-containing protein [Nioella sp. MMSF_3534]|uniref:Hint domain-containing protein n=1 Tax=Nioella sp. MMSF_3534 TaxID=3046720 RepID=UPI00273F6790|nr:Hint domain-containing protein [Nioella sp. MMSF_3534]